MIVSSATLSEFGPDKSKDVIGTLTRLFTELRSSPPPGFLQSMLLRSEHSENGEAVLLTMWESNADLNRFVASEDGEKMAKQMHALLGDCGKSSRNQYFVTWQSDIYKPRAAQTCADKINRRTQQ